MRFVFGFFLTIWVVSLGAVDLAKLSDNKDISGDIKYIRLPNRLCSKAVLDTLPTLATETPENPPLVVGIGDVCLGVTASLSNSSSHPISRLFSVEYAHYTEFFLKLSSKRQNKTYSYTEHDHSGWMYPHSIYPVFPITVQPEERVTLAFIIHNGGHIRLPVFLKTRKNFLTSLGSRNVFIITLISIMLFIGLLSLVISVFIKSSVFGYFGLTIVAYALLMLHDDGYSRILFWHYSEYTNKTALRFLHGGTVAAGVLFAERFLRQHHISEIVQWGFRALLIIALIMTAAVPLISSESALLIHFLVASTFLLYVFFSTLYSSSTTYRSVQLFLLGWAAVGIGAFAFFLMTIGVLPDMVFTVFGPQFGGFIGMIFLFSSLLVDLQVHTKTAIKHLRTTVMQHLRFKRMASHILNILNTEIQKTVASIRDKTINVSDTAPYSQAMRYAGKLEIIHLLSLTAVIKALTGPSQITDSSHYLVDITYITNIFHDIMPKTLKKNENNRPLFFNTIPEYFISLIGGILFYTTHNSSDTVRLSIKKELGNQATLTISSSLSATAADKLTKRIHMQPSATETHPFPLMDESDIATLFHVLGIDPIISLSAEQTNIIITLPLTTPRLTESAPESRAEPQKPQPVDITGSVVLIVDDEPINLKVLTTMLERDNFIVETASSGDEALKKITETTPDIVMLDIMLPDISGTELAKTIRKKHNELALPLIFVSARTDADTMITAYENGGNDFVVKPIERSILLKKMRLWLSLSSQFKDR